MTPFLHLDAGPAGLLTVGLAAAFGVVVRLFPDLRTPVARAGILSLQLAGSKAKAQRVIASWGRGRRPYVSLVVDGPFIVIYSTLLAVVMVCCARLAGRYGFLGAGTVHDLAASAPFAAWAAGAFDLAENVGLLLMLGLRPTSVRAAVATGCACAKLALIVGDVLLALALLAIAVFT